MVHIWVINEHASSHSRLKSYVQKGLQLPALLYITEDADKRGLQVQHLEQSALNQRVQEALVSDPTNLSALSAATTPNPVETNGVETLTGTEVHEVYPPTAGADGDANAVVQATYTDDSEPPQPKPVSASPHEELSVRELQTLMLLGQGLSVSGIARNLALSVKTISTYRARALEKLHLNTTADLIRYAVEHLLLPGSNEIGNRQID